jgi:hypothetical protein
MLLNTYNGALCLYLETIEIIIPIAIDYMFVIYDLV